MGHSCVWCNFGLHLNGFHPYRGWCIKQTSNPSSKQEDRFHYWPYMVGLTKVCPIKIKKCEILIVYQQLTIVWLASYTYSLLWSLSVHFQQHLSRSTTRCILSVCSILVWDRAYPTSEITYNRNVTVII